MEGKICKTCGEYLPAKKFNKTKNTQCGLTTNCRDCSNKYLEERRKDPEYKSYKETNPEAWRVYQNEYMKEYKKNPLVRLKDNIFQVLRRLKKKEMIKSGTSCEKCGKECETKAFFEDSFIKRYLKLGTSPNLFTIIKAVKWRCPECLGKSRRK